MQALGDDDVGQRIDEGDIPAGSHREVMGGLDVQGAHEVDAPRVRDDDPGTLAEATLHAGAEDRVGIGGGWPR